MTIIAVGGSIMGREICTFRGEEGPFRGERGPSQEMAFGEVM